MSNILLINSVLPWVTGILPPRETAALAEFPQMRVPALLLHKSDAASVKPEVESHRNKAVVFLCLPCCTLCRPTTSSR